MQTCISKSASSNFLSCVLFATHMQIDGHIAGIAIEIVQVLLHPDQAGKFLSASEDGLVAVFSIADGLDEDQGFEVMLPFVLQLCASGFAFRTPYGIVDPCARGLRASFSKSF